jgi:hypothetical protein
LYLNLITLPANASDEHSRQHMEPLDIQGFTYEQRQGVIAELTAVLSNCGGWVLERKNISPTNLEFRVEIQLRAALDLYAALVASGLELTRSGHEALTGLCTRQQYSRITVELGRTVVLRLEISFFDDFALNTLLRCAYGPS